MKRYLLSSVAHSALPKMTVGQIADVLAKAYRSLGLTHLDRFAS